MASEAWEKFLRGEYDPKKMRLTPEEFKALIMGFIERVPNMKRHQENHICCFCPACRPEYYERDRRV